MAAQRFAQIKKLLRHLHQLIEDLKLIVFDVGMLILFVHVLVKMISGEL